MLIKVYTMAKKITVFLLAVILVLAMGTATVSAQEGSEPLTDTGGTGDGNNTPPGRGTEGEEENGGEGDEPASVGGSSINTLSLDQNEGNGEEDFESEEDDGTSGEVPGSSIEGTGSNVQESNVFWQEDPSTGILAEGAENVFPAGTFLYITSLESGEEYEGISMLMSMIADQFRAFDIRFLSMTDYSMQEPAGTVSISIPIPEGYDTAHLSVSCLGEDGTRTEMGFWMSDGKAVFETDHAGTFIVAQMKALPDSLEMTEKTEKLELREYAEIKNPGGAALTQKVLPASPKTGDSTSLAVWGVVLGAAAIVLVITLVLKVWDRKKK